MKKQPWRPKQTTLGCWRNSEVLERRVATIVYRQDRSDPEIVTEVTMRLQRLARRVLGPSGLDDDRNNRLCQLALRAKPSEITRALQSWRFQLPDRTVRALHGWSGIQEMRWQ